MDVRMPILDGVAATREITTALPCVRIVALTGSTTAPSSARCSKQARRILRQGSPGLERAGHRGPRSRRPTGADARRGGRPRPDPRRRHPTRSSQPAQEVAPASDRPARFEPRRPQPRLGPDHPTRVLVVDDDERLRILLLTTSRSSTSRSTRRHRSGGVGSDHRKPARRRGARSQTARPGRPHALRGAKGDPRTRDIGIVVLAAATRAPARRPGSRGRRVPASRSVRSTCSRSSKSLRADSTKGRSRFPTHLPPEEQLIRYAGTSGGCSSSSRASGP